MNAKKIQIGNVYRAKVDGTFLPVHITASLGHGRYKGTNMRTDAHVKPSEATVKICTGDIKGAGQTIEEWKARQTGKDETAATVEAVEKGNLADGITVPVTKRERKPAEPRKSLTNAAILVLAKAKEPMNAKAIVDAATTNGWYEPGNGKTPEATLYSAMLRDKKARFLKAERGVWTLTDAGKAEVEAIRHAFDGKVA